MGGHVRRRGAAGAAGVIFAVLLAACGVQKAQAPSPSAPQTTGVQESALPEKPLAEAAGPDETSGAQQPPSEPETPQAETPQAETPQAGGGPDEGGAEQERENYAMAEPPETEGGEANTFAPPVEERQPSRSPPPTYPGRPIAPAPAPVPEAPPAPPPAPGEPERIQKVTVYFGTDRALETVRGARVFGRSEATGLYYGLVDVTIPPGHQEGELESPQWWRFEFNADPEKHVTYQGYTLMTRDVFYQRLRDVVSRSQEKQAFVFVHGFNTSFEDAARRTAQLYKDLRFDGAPIFYSWPSQAELSLFGYNRDVTLSARTEPRLEAFLKEVAARTGARRIHLIAHSMGNKALVNALARMAASRSQQTAPLFNQIVLTAPDIDREVFLDLARRMRGAGQQVTLYASANDKALQASKSYNGFPRAGDAGASIIVAPGITTVDASNVTTAVFDLEHSYFASEKDVLTDLRTLISTGRPAAQRGLKPVSAPSGGAYYVID